MQDPGTERTRLWSQSIIRETERPQFVERGREGGASPAGMF